MTNLGDELNTYEVDKLINEANMDGDGTVNYMELTRRMFQRKYEFERVNKSNVTKNKQKNKKIKK